MYGASVRLGCPHQPLRGVHATRTVGAMRSVQALPARGNLPAVGKRRTCSCSMKAERIVTEGPTPPAAALGGTSCADVHAAAC